MKRLRSCEAACELLEKYNMSYQMNTNWMDELDSKLKSLEELEAARAKEAWEKHVVSEKFFAFLFFSRQKYRLHESKNRTRAYTEFLHQSTRDISICKWSAALNCPLFYFLFLDFIYLRYSMYKIISFNLRFLFFPLCFAILFSLYKSVCRGIF